LFAFGVAVGVRLVFFSYRPAENKRTTGEKGNKVKKRLAAPPPYVRSFVRLFVCLFVCLFGWLVGWLFVWV
jgi:hypothetical protein